MNVRFTRAQQAATGRLPSWPSPLPNAGIGRVPESSHALDFDLGPGRHLHTNMDALFLAQPSCTAVRLLRLTFCVRSRPTAWWMADETSSSSSTSVRNFCMSNTKARTG